MTDLLIQQLNFDSFSDERGILTAVEGSSSIPFNIERVFFMHHVPADVDRGGHAHRYTKQVLIACHGSMDIICSDGVSEFSITLDDPNKGILVPEMIWTNLKNFKNNGVCMVLANTHYVMNHSIRTWDEYLEATHTDLTPNSNYLLKSAKGKS
jgi:hypothetical protein